MRVTKSQIIRGVSDYIKNEILPKMDEDRAVQIVATIAVNAALNNDKILDGLMQNEIVRTLLDDDGSGTYDISGLMAAMRDAVNQYGAFPFKVPSIPFLSAREITLRLNAADVDAMRSKIENAAV